MGDIFWIIIFSQVVFGNAAQVLEPLKKTGLECGKKTPDEG